MNGREGKHLEQPHRENQPRSNTDIRAENASPRIHGPSVSAASSTSNTRLRVIRQQTAVDLISIRAHLAEFGIVAPVGRKGVTELLACCCPPSDKRVPEVARACLAALGTQLLRLKQQILEFDRMVMAWHAPTKRASAFITFRVGPMLATALVASVADPRTFRSGRNFSGLDRARSKASTRVE